MHSIRQHWKNKETHLLLRKKISTFIWDMFVMSRIRFSLAFPNINLNLILKYSVFFAWNKNFITCVFKSIITKLLHQSETPSSWNLVHCIVTVRTKQVRMMSTKNCINVLKSQISNICYTILTMRTGVLGTVFSCASSTAVFYLKVVNNFCKFLFNTNGVIDTKLGCFNRNV